MSIPNSQFIPHTNLSPLVTINFSLPTMFVFCEPVSVFINKFICIIFFDSTYEQYHIFVFLWHFSLSLITLGFIHVAANGFISRHIWAFWHQLWMVFIFPVSTLWGNVVTNKENLQGLSRVWGVWSSDTPEKRRVCLTALWFWTTLMKVALPPRWCYGTRARLIFYCQLEGPVSIKDCLVSIRLKAPMP